MFPVILLLMLVILLAGCSSSSQKTSALKENAKTEKEYKEVTIDNYGEKLVISQKPQKVLTLGPNATELFIALGLSDYVIGNSLNNHSRGALPAYKEQYEKIPELTHGSATREAVLTSGADFIYGIDWEFGEAGLDKKELASSGIITYQNSALTLEQIYKEINDLGKIFQIEDKAKAFIADQQSRIAKVKEKLENKKTVNVLVYDSGGEGVFTAGGTNFESLLIEQAGGKNIFSDIKDKQWTTVSFEKVLEKKPDYIVIHDYDAPSAEKKIEEIKNNPALSQLDCVKQEKFVVITLESVLPGDRMAYTVEELAKGFHPDLFR
ncbi:iron ABC transporter substrate-binding protein [Niallia nealsonii]|uniref:Iron ABC transporter substrate-binding protein n=2 Tax=Niallia nealsonii TaxID=115979 RepID=A0A2N0Z483_9BACI|nr:iron ABC transporter substrate-binding protein [Niallia nealsonii]